MTGPIIGDLAAWTYEHDRECFYRALISPHAQLSEWGLYYLEALNCLFSGKGQLRQMPFLRDQKQGEHDPRWLSGMVMVAGIEGWLRDVEPDDGCTQPFPLEKPDWYAYRILRQAVYRLRQGDTKYRIAKAEFPLEMLTTPQYQAETYSSLSILCRCWPHFKNAFDFTSAIHNAARSDADRHLACMFTALLAEAMYGSEQIMLKKKYTGQDAPPWGDGAFQDFENLVPLEYRETVVEARRYMFRNRVFFPKNNARTNVERHIWTPISIPSLENIHFSKEARRRILKSFYTGWDNRYGFYWDDGWFYVYRSFHLIGRFRLSLNDDGTYSMVQIQSSDDVLDLKVAIEETIYPTLFSWSRFGDEDVATTLQRMFKFYEPGVENSGDSNHLNHWWLWEKMFWENNVGSGFRRITDWGEIDGEAYECLHKEYNGFCHEELCLIDYFAGMLGKWFPYYNVDEAIKTYIEF